MKKHFILIIIVCLIVLTMILALKKDIVKAYYSYKYEKRTFIEKNIDLDNDYTSQSLININNLSIELKNLEINENKLLLQFCFNSNDNLNNVGYLLRVYNNDYYLGNRYAGKISLSNNELYFYNAFFNTEIYGQENIASKDLLNETRFKYKTINSETENKLIQEIEYEFPENFIPDDLIHIDLLDINYQIEGNSDFHKIDNQLTEIRYNISLNKNHV